MGIDEYLSQAGITAAKFADAIGISAVSLGRIARGEQNTTRDVIRRIIAESGGAITAGDVVHAPADTAAPAGVSAGKGGGNSDRSGAAPAPAPVPAGGVA